MTTEAAPASGVVVEQDERAGIAALVVELEGRPMSRFRTLPEPAAVAERRAERIGDDELINRARLLTAGVLLREGRSEEGGRAAHQVLAWAEREGSPYLLARTHRELAIFYRQVGDSATALTHAVQCVGHLTDDVAPVVRARHLLSLATALDETGSAEEAERRFREALRVATAVGDHELALYILNNMAYTASETGDEPAARALIEHMRDVQASSGAPFSANELDTIARVEMMSGRYDAVEATLRAVLEAGQTAVLGNEGDAFAMCLLTLAEARRAAGRHDATQEALDAALRMCDERGLHAVRAQVREEQALLYADTGRYREAFVEHRAFHAESTALHSAQREARARALQAVFEATEARRSSDHFREMAHRDALTGLYNRRFVNERLPDLIGDATVRRTPLALAIVDLDHFKRVNDTLSHSTGDTVLVQVAQMLTEAATGPAIAARMGGEEFLLIMPGADLAEAARRCEALRLRIRAHSWAAVTGSLPVTTSIGVTAATEGRSTPSALLSQADRNLYAAKRSGRDRVVADIR
ncbi:tetratricopeptide repeat-containing diguanylate cyclase [Actinoplanes sp. NBRC 103695]|uniref:GGDEF domain-containing protein n=1 Tax=Actinoplanes sp. NBRC 103695 TaxID=3032202 RepID=UPI0024A5F5DB|nr:tetratricopeptide repeat-containing diguanylate cyclase [Actinoplanes sp. NBRC 103695]GLY94435.1 GGDEF domain-containing protein [Actinoplanes sp. NBRC 103695]